MTHPASTARECPLCKGMTTRGTRPSLSCFWDETRSVMRSGQCHLYRVLFVASLSGMGGLRAVHQICLRSKVSGVKKQL